MIRGEIVLDLCRRRYKVLEFTRKSQLLDGAKWTEGGPIGFRSVGLGGWKNDGGGACLPLILSFPPSLRAGPRVFDIKEISRIIV